MQRLAVMLAGALLCLCAALLESGVARADPPSCRQYDSLCFCVVEAHQGRTSEDHEHMRA
jgi:hypothetical protein